MPLQPIGPERKPDKLRLCPTCRMEISVLATKCRYCGDDVGRPRDEQRNLTIDDLGGETVEHYVPSSSVMDALEAFRSEEVLRKQQPDTKRKSIFRRRSDSEKEGQGPDPLRDGLPELDAQSKSLASPGRHHRPATPGSSRRATKRTGGSPSWTKKVGAFAAVVAAIIILYFGGMKVAAVIREISSKPSGDFGPPSNPAVAMMEANRPALKVLEAAAKYEREYGTPESREVLEKIRGRAQSEILGLLEQEPYTQENHHLAESQANQAHASDPCDMFVELEETVAAELRAYRTVLAETDPDESPPTATFRVVNSNQTVSEITVAEGGVFLDGRFRLQAVMDDHVRIIDVRRGRRRLKLVRLQEITAI